MFRPTDSFHSSPYPHFESLQSCYVHLSHCPCLCAVKGYAPNQRFNHGLQSVLNAAARLICNRRKYDHVTSLLRDVLHWLPVPFRIEYKLCLLVFQSLHGAAPEYLRDCCTATHSSASRLQLRSLERTDLRVRRMKTHFGDRAFSAAGPRCWNSLPPVIRFADSVDSFKSQLKTHL